MINLESLEAGEGTTVQIVMCPYCGHKSALVAASAYACRAQCVDCGRIALLAWTSAVQPTLVLSSRSATS